MLVLATAATAGAARADVVTDWNGTAVMAVQTLDPSTPIQLRALGIVHLAMFDVLNAIDRRGPAPVVVQSYCQGIGG
jgi:hypothetical protein